MEKGKRKEPFSYGEVKEMSTELEPVYSNSNEKKIETVFSQITRIFSNRKVGYIPLKVNRDKHMRVQ